MVFSSQDSNLKSSNSDDENNGLDNNTVIIVSDDKKDEINNKNSGHNDDNEENDPVMKYIQEKREEKIQEEEMKRREEELVRRFRTNAFRQKMKLFGIALVSNVVFLTLLWVLPGNFVHVIFLGYIIIGALPKFLFGSILMAHKPHVRDKPPNKDKEKKKKKKESINMKMKLKKINNKLTSLGNLSGRIDERYKKKTLYNTHYTNYYSDAHSNSDSDSEYSSSDDDEGNIITEKDRVWDISAPAFKCTRCGSDVMGWEFCRECGKRVDGEHPILVTACCTVHHEDDKGIDGGVHSFEVSELPFKRKYLQLVYIVDGRYSRSGTLDFQQRDTVRFLLSRLYNVPDSAISNGGEDEVVTVTDPNTGTPQPTILESDGTAVYRGTMDEMPFVVLVKRMNRGKRDSHRMFFEYMDSKCGILEKTAVGILFMDSDTVLTWDDDRRDSLKNLYLGLAKRENVGGACGEIEVQNWSANPITMMQHFEYKSNQFLAKTAENWFGMVTCLPGAFSMVRPQAMEMVLNDYLAESQNIWEKNQLDLGEDRTLTTLILKSGWDTTYIEKAIARTEAPSTLTGFIKQRRRWINSTIVNMVLLLRTVHRPSSFPLIASLFLELISTFTLPTTVLLMFISTFEGMSLHKPFVVGIVIMWCVLLILFSMTATAERSAAVFKVSASIGAFLMAMTVVQIVQNVDRYWSLAWLELVVLVGWFFMIVVAALIHGQWKSIACVVAPLSWFFMSPCTYLIVPIFALCNFDDVSWGTRGA